MPITLLFMDNLGGSEVLFLAFLPLVALLLLVWLLRRPKPTGASVTHVADELQKLHQLREQGVLSEAEFEEQKRRLLK